MDIKEKLIEILKTKYDHFCDQCSINKDSKYIENLASHLISNGVTVARHGRWIYNIESGEYVCSACGENALSFRKDTLYGGDLYEICLTDYCPNCGARMDEEAR